MEESITSRLTEPTRQFLQLLVQHKTVRKLKRAEPEITDRQVRKAETEVFQVLGYSPERAIQQIINELKRNRNRALKLPPPNSVYQIKITLVGTKPPIWRRFVVPAAITLPQLHAVIQVVMGWTDSHLHAFDISGDRYVLRSLDGEPLDLDGEDEARFSLRDVVREEKAQFSYEYDFGDSWEHLLVVEKIAAAVAKANTFQCVEGKGACPPEDCGGIWGYYNLVEAVKDRKHPDHDDMIEWLGEDFDPDAVDLAQINESLGWFMKKRPGRTA